jgi:hypothetical protein
MTAAPPTPSRVRVVRPTFYRSGITGPLPPDVRDCLIGLTTITDDEGWLVWNPDEIATTIYAYQPARKRRIDLERRAERLVDAGLLVIHPCGCAELPTLKEHHGVKSGRQTTPIWGWHHDQRHAVGRGMPGNAEEPSSSSSSSSSSSDSFEGSSSSSSRARDGSDGQEAAEPRCEECRRPTSIHDPLCSRSPHLRAVG